jgi:hypothetical protein
MHVLLVNEYKLDISIQKSSKGAKFEQYLYARTLQHIYSRTDFTAYLN